MSQLSMTPERPSSLGQSQDVYGPLSSVALTASDSQDPKATTLGVSPTHRFAAGAPFPPLHGDRPASFNSQGANFAFSGLLLANGPPADKIVAVLESGTPNSIANYAEHLYKVGSLLYDGAVTELQRLLLERKFYLLTDMFPTFEAQSDPAQPLLYLIIERCFDLFIKLSVDGKKVALASHTIRFLTTVIMSLNYWELYNLLQWKPAIYQFLSLIHFDMNECYASFIRDYGKHSYRPAPITEAQMQRAQEERSRKRSSVASASESESSDMEADSEGRTPLYYMNKELSEDHDRFVLEQMAQVEQEKPIPRERRKIRVDSKLAAHRIIKRADIKVAATSRSSNYDPDVVHECQLPSLDEPHRLCLRRFSRKYELIRHQETVHLKRKKLFKCFVCVKQDPTIGPRIFTRHDTLAKHIRVNHRISGKEAKAEVAYSKKHAEIVEDGDITVHVGRRKTKVDFELRAHMERKGSEGEGSIMYDEIDDLPPDLIDSDEIYEDQ